MGNLCLKSKKKNSLLPYQLKPRILLKSTGSYYPEKQLIKVRIKNYKFIKHININDRSLLRQDASKIQNTRSCRLYHHNKVGFEKPLSAVSMNRGIRKLKHLSNLLLSDVVCFSPEQFRVMKKLPRLSALNVLWTFQDTSQATYAYQLGRVLKYLRLKTLHISGLASGLASALKSLVRMTSLSSLTLNCFTLSKKDIIDKLVKALNKTTNLSVLHLSINLADVSKIKQFEDLLRAVGRLNCLSDLSLPIPVQETTVDNNLGNLANALSHLHYLTKLRLTLQTKTNIYQYHLEPINKVAIALKSLNSLSAVELFLYADYLDVDTITSLQFVEIMRYVKCPCTLALSLLDITQKFDRIQEIKNIIFASPSNLTVQLKVGTLDHISSCASAINHIKIVKSLHLDSRITCTDNNEKPMVILAKAIESFTSLVSISLSFRIQLRYRYNFFIPIEGLTEFFRGLGNLTLLSKLKLDFTNTDPIGIDELQVLANSLSKLISLSEVSLDFNANQPNKDFFDAIGSLSQLKSFIFYNYYRGGPGGHWDETYSDVNMIAVAKVIGKLEKLKCLMISFPVSKKDVKDGRVKVLLQAAKQHPSLVKFALKGFDEFVINEETWLPGKFKTF